uniref:DUF6533 domain-containing protein n=1 Tax=Moniliophthora roreri TaxID=221103 RepID=A0A0W0FIM9_MONRR
MDTLAPRNTPIIISSVLLLYDYLLTFDLEANYVWTHPLTFRSAIFFLNRYTPFVDTFLSLSRLLYYLYLLVISVFNIFSPWIQPAWGPFLLVPQRVLHSIFCNRVLFFLFKVGFDEERERGRLQGGYYGGRAGDWGTSREEGEEGEIICVALIVWKQLTSIHMLQTLEGCISSGSSNELLHLAPFVLLALTETVLAILSVIKGYQDLRNTRERWVVELYKDGLLYYLYLLVLSIFNIFSPWIRPAWGPFLVTPQRVLHSLFCNRILFFLLKVGVDEEQKERERERLQGGYYGGRAGDWGTSVEEGEGVRFTTVQMDVVGTVR